MRKGSNGKHQIPLLLRLLDFTTQRPLDLSTSRLHLSTSPLDFTTQPLDFTTQRPLDFTSRLHDLSTSTSRLKLCQINCSGNDRLIYLETDVNLFKEVKIIFVLGRQCISTTSRPLDSTTSRLHDSTTSRS